MLILNSSNRIIKDYVQKGKVVARGYNSVILNNNIKLNRVYHHNLNINFASKADEVFDMVYKDRALEPLCSLEYLNKLQSMKKNTYGTEGDSGAIVVNEVVVGTIGASGILETNKFNYQQLTIDSFNNVSELVKILDIVLGNLGVLEEQGLSYQSLSTYEGDTKPIINMLYTKNGANLDIRFANLGGEDFGFAENFDPEIMYQEYMLLLKRLIAKFDSTYPEVMEMLREVNYQNINNYEDALKVTEEVKKMVLK